MTRDNYLNSPYCREARKNSEVYVILFINFDTDILAFININFSLYRVFSHLRGEPGLEGKKINFLKVISLLAQNEFYEEVEELMYGAGIAD